MSMARQILSSLLRTNTIEMGTNLIWVDLEMTGLDVDKCTILEMACIVTDKELNIIAEGPNICINHPESVLTSMESWSQNHHDKSGLTNSCRKSSYSLKDTEMEMLKFVRQHTPAGLCPLAGNSIGTDKMFLTKYMPDFTSHLHYRIVDVSSVKELCKRWYPRQFLCVPHKKECHRAMEDIMESIEELKYYRTSIFK